MGRSISSPVKFKREAPPQMSSAPRSVPKTDAGGGKLALERSEKSAPSCTVSAAEHARRKLRAGGWSAAEMLRPIAASAKCDRNAVRIAASAKCGRNAVTDCCQREVRQKCSQNCCQRTSAAEMPSELQPARSAAEMSSLWNLILRSKPSRIPLHPPSCREVLWAALPRAGI